MICEYLHIPVDVWFGTKFVLQLLIALLIYALRLKKRERWYLNLLYCVIAIGIVAYPLYLLDQVCTFFAVPVFLFYIYCLILVECIYDVSIKDALFIWISGCATQYFVSQSYSLVNYFAGSIVGEIVEAVVLLCFYPLCYFTFAKKLSEETVDSINNFVVTAISTVTFFISDIIVNIARNFNWENPVSNIYGMTLVIFILLLDFNIFSKAKAEKERDLIEQLLKKEEDQYRVTKEALNYIDIKSHDLKYQVQYLKSISSSKQFDQAIGSMEQKIDEYENIVKTSNSTLNTVLTEKNLYCLQFHIKLYYIVDGDAISFMKPEDIYALFGNLLDNAIECLKDESEDKRIIDLNVCRKANLLSITTINTCTRKRTFIDNLPTTTKEDNKTHGYGTKSIRFIAEKYSGTAAFNQQGDSFIASALIPIKLPE